MVISSSKRVKQRFRQRIYRLLLRFLGLSDDYKGDVRSSLGVSPYARRSPLLLTIYNLRELNAYLADRSDAKFFRPATRALRNSEATSQALVLGNGPSLAKLNAKMVVQDNPDIWVVNDFYKVKQAADLMVMHYVLSDGVHLMGQSNEINSKLKPVLDYAQSKSASLFRPHRAKIYSFLG